jgi:hypothetical protein
VTTATHELRIYASVLHARAKHGELLLHLWFRGEPAMQMDLDIALRRPDVAYVDLTDCVNHTTKRLYPRLPAPRPRRPKR